MKQLPLPSKSTRLTRRSFLKWAGVAATVPTLGQLVACAPQANAPNTGSDDALLRLWKTRASGSLSLLPPELLG